MAGALGLRFYPGVPLTTPDGYNLGTLCVIAKIPRTVSEADVATLADLAAMVVDELELRRAVRRTVEVEQELRRQAKQFSVALQTSLLPCPPAIPGAEIGALFRPAGGAQVGGDFYDLFPLSTETWAIVIGDVRSKGPLAASRSALARYSLRGAAVHGEDSPADTLQRVNQAMLAGRSPRRLVLHSRVRTGKPRAGEAPSSVVERLASVININDDDAAILTLRAI